MNRTAWQKQLFVITNLIPNQDKTFAHNIPDTGQLKNKLLDVSFKVHSTTHESDVKFCSHFIVNYIWLEDDSATISK